MIDKKILSFIKKALKSHESFNHKRGILTTVLFIYDLKFKEIEDYLDKYRTRYFENLKRLKEQLAGKKDELTIKKEATKYLNIEPFRLKNRELYLLHSLDRENNIFLFEGPYILDMSISDRKKIVKLLGGIEQFQYNIKFYFAKGRGPASIIYSPPEDDYRKRLMSLYETGLALKGKEIPDDILVEAIIKINQFNELKKILVQHGITTKFKRKRDIIEVAKQDKSIRDIIFSQYAEIIEDIFYLKPLPINFKYEDFEKYWNYTWEIAGFIMRILG